jgi:sugar phosphate isomerase/epimerase
MIFIMFTKHLIGKSIGEIIGILRDVGVEGADLCVRPGYPVNPENAHSALPAAARDFEREGLSIPLVTAPTDFTDPGISYAERLYGACAESGVGLLKIGYWRVEEDGYWATLDRVRRKLDGFSRLSERFGVKTCIHIHSGGNMGLNASSAMDMVCGFDPRYLGIFADTGHLSISGEPIGMALEMTKEYLSAIAFKDLVRERILRDGRRGWQVRVVPIGEGYVEWPEVLKAMRKVGFDGPISFHSEYSGYPVETVVDMTRIDVRFIRSLMEA